MIAVLAVLLAVPAPRAALLDERPAVATVARAERKSEPLRGVAEYFAGLAAFTLVNAAGSALLSELRVTIARGGHVSFHRAEASLAGGARPCCGSSPPPSPPSLRRRP